MLLADARSLPKTQKSMAFYKLFFEINLLVPDVCLVSQMEGGKGGGIPKLGVLPR